jgi:hypothetical protein
MRLSSSLRTSLLASAASLLVSGAGAGPMPTHVVAMKSMAEPTTTQVQWRGGFRGGGFGFRGGGWRGGGWRGGGWGWRGAGYGLAAGALVGGAIASSAYYGGYGGYYGGYGYPSYSYAAAPYYGYGGGYGYGSYCPPYGGGYARAYYGW